MAKITNEVIYRDFDFRFIAHPITGKLIVRKNSEAIKQAFKLLIMTNLYERPYRPTFGSNVRNHLFENFTAFTAENIRNAITTAAENFEPRIELIDVQIGGDPDRNQLAVTIIYRPINSTQPDTLNFNLERVR